MSEVGDEGKSRGSMILSWVQLALAAFLLCWSLLAVFEAPIDFLWKPAIAATEWGHLLGLVCLGTLALPGWRERPGQVAVGLAVVGALLFFSSLFRATSVAADLPQRLSAAFGDATPLSLEGAPARTAPLAFGDLFSLGGSPEVSVTQHVYAEAEGEKLKADLYLRSGTDPRPVVIAIHGGSWSGGDQTQLPAINRYLAARGYAVIAISYRLAPRFTFPAAYEDVLAAVAWVEREGPNLGLDPKRIVLLGRSAGGHLALLAGYTPRHPAILGVVAYYPPTDMVWSYEHPSNPWVYDSVGVLGDFLRGSPAEQPQLYAAASPLPFASASSPPTLLVHGARDELVFQRQSERLAERLSELGVAHLHLALPWATHGCDANLSGPSGQLSTYAIERFLASVLATAP
jgi:acetyl esterase/lipase